MSWQYGYGVDAVDLLDIFDAVVVDDESGSGRQGGNQQVGFLDGERWEEKPYAPLDVTLKAVVSYTGPGGAVTHPDGPAGHFYANLAAMHRLFNGPGLKHLTRAAPDWGDVRAEFETLTILRGEHRHVYYLVLRIPSGSWQSVAQQSATGNPPAITTGGTRRIHDPELEFPAAAAITVTDSAGVAHTVTVEGGPAFPVTVSLRNAEWTAIDDNGDDASQHVTTTQPWVMRFEANTTLDVATTGTVTARWRNRWG
jgi:hypothetical protein